MKVILDHDGLLTDLEQEAKDYPQKFEDLFFEKLDSHEKSDFSSFVRYVKHRVESNPAAGWEQNGFIVAPATADPYILTTVTFQQIAKQLMIPNERELLNGIHQQAYAGTPTIYRKGARELLDKLRDKDACIITNSNPDIVKAKLATLECSLPVFGFAKKYAVDPTWKAVWERANLPGFPRPVFLRRKSYDDALVAAGAKLGDVVAGDIYELDLAMPEFCGYKVFQLETPTTPLYEKKHMGDRMVQDLSTLGERLTELL